MGFFRRLFRLSQPQTIKDLELSPDVFDRFHAYYERPDSPEFKTAVQEIFDLADGGDENAIRSLADLTISNGPFFDPEAAYKWHYVMLSLDGYAVSFADDGHNPPYYHGPVGDFRNESIVSDLVCMLGFERVRALDEQAARWMAERRLNPRELT